MSPTHEIRLTLTIDEAREFVRLEGRVIQETKQIHESLACDDFSQAGNFLSDLLAIASILGNANFDRYTQAMFHSRAQAVRSALDAYRVAA